ncbi:cell division protein [Nonlabens spongiae]|uniref:Cell division protein n=1 Tax=Nonlabens spongiae TaxID=331648 RepID=A0A1W6MNY2_9FLAO|nr:ATP-binding protein [Nonlabens spongiae]ARN79272.1 cell division protein [Nonlabens spongiae]
MSNTAIESLREALKVSPDNIPLRLHLAKTLQQHQLLEEAQEEYEIVLQYNQSLEARQGLAIIAYKLTNYSKAIVILENLLDEGNNDLDTHLFYTRSLLKSGDDAQAMEAYKTLLEHHPDFSEKELDEKFRMAAPDGNADFLFDDDDEEYFDDYEETDVFIEKPEMDFSHVGGMDEVKKEIDLKIVQPLLHPEIYKAYGKKIGGGILLYGPPGCGKTYIARATAGQINAKFISVSLNDILDMWIGSSEKNLHHIFETARDNTPCVLFIDEIDALGASRSDMKQSAGKNIINQFLQELDGINQNNEGLLILGATNMPWHLDTAFRRPGRFDRILFVPPPDTAAREAIFDLKLKEKPTDAIDSKQLAKKSPEYSGADIEAAIDIAVESKLEEAINSGVPQSLKTKDILKAIKKHKPSTKEWFVTAKNFALYANESGLYDNILEYLKIKK